MNRLLIFILFLVWAGAAWMLVRFVSYLCGGDCHE